MVTADEQRTVLVTGANRGVGLEFVTQYAARGWTVIAGCRDTKKAQDLQDLAASDSKITVEPLDVTNVSQIGALASKYDNTAVDVVINNAGQYGDLDRQSWGSLDPALFHEIMDVNVIGPMKVSEAFTPHLYKGLDKKIVSITSFLGSISSVSKSPSTPFYAASKAALNMVMRGIGKRLEDKGIAVVVFMPGLVETRMLRQTFGLPLEEAEKAENFDYRDLPTITATQSVSGMIPLIDALSLETSGRFLNYDGKEIPW
ncbi:MAG: SDR family oxidoreductase [Rhodospirillaceae bacterium]|jgi:NAD(P)-dependent dehydrogenase (short-subunit alcohol dehydrogenase family)